jgi:hypothetical protein
VHGENLLRDLGQAGRIHARARRSSQRLATQLDDNPAISRHGQVPFPAARPGDLANATARRQRGWSAQRGRGGVAGAAPGWLGPKLRLSATAGHGVPGGNDRWLPMRLPSAHSPAGTSAHWTGALVSDDPSDEGISHVYVLHRPAPGPPASTAAAMERVPMQEEPVKARLRPAGLALAAAVALPALPAAQAHASATPAVWMLSRTALAGVTANATVAAGLSSDTVYQVSNPAATDTAVTSNAVISYHEYGGAQAASNVNGGNLPAGTGAIVLDQEDWQGSCQGSGTCTPLSDLDGPVKYATEAATAAQKAGLAMIVTPALDLFDGTGTLPCSTSYYLCYLSYNMAGKMAAIPGVDVIDLQAQSLETKPSTYLSFVQRASAQARKANPGIVVVAGLSTSPNTPASPTVSQLEQDASAVQPYVNGFWMNIPDGDNAMAEKVMIAEGA